LFNSLISRVILLNVLLLILGVGSFAMYHLQREQKHLINVHRQSAQLVLDTVERAISHSMSVGDTDNVQAMLEKVGEGSPLQQVYVFDLNGTIKHSSDPQLIGTAAPEDAVRLFQQHKIELVHFVPGGKQILTVQRPITANKNCFRCHGISRGVIGVLNIDFSLAHMEDQLRETGTIFVHSTMVNLIVLALAISIIMSRMLRRPLGEISEAMRQVEAGDLSVRMEQQSNDEVGQLIGGFNSMVDNLDRAQNELQKIHYQQMERADRLASIGEMAAGLAHEIKNPLAGIGGAINVLADDYPEGDPRREVMAQIQKQVDRMNKTVTDLLYFGRPGKPEFSYVDINSLIKQTQLFASQHPEAKNVNWIEELTRDLPPVWGDQKQIQQVLLNLMINGLQAMKDGGVLTVQTELCSENGRDLIQVDIRDTGPGIPEPEMKNIFTPFYTSKTEGTGLGLPICRQLLETNGGSLKVSSVVEKGACFTVLLPIAEGQEGALLADQKADQ